MSTERKVASNRSQDLVKVSGSDRTRRARKAGPHGKVKQADGSTQASPNKHKSTSGGNGGDNLQ
jgi:hypothetical protein